ncbi:energy transducer TonB [Qipengyuania seohaensis]|uniref:energy transducer TonB n=1 Tax=Qipengyuania seohaensis TaxID=266951 RepID=UPI000C22B691|nr:energy transducer TonB [Qipengyuania seohaensis]
MAYADQEMSGNRIVAIIIVALIHIGLGYALITGLALDVAKSVVERVTTIDVEEPPPPEPEDEPPPPPEDIPETAPPPPVAPQPPISIAPAPPQFQTQVNIPPPAPPAVRIPPPAPPAPPAPPPAPSKARGASPKGQSSWASRIQRNYPRRAERDGVEGNVGVSVTVGTDGRVAGCTVTSSSGSSDLDAAACDGMTRYARFDPALNTAGDPITDTYRTTIVYRLN